MHVPWFKELTGSEEGSGMTKQSASIGGESARTGGPMKNLGGRLTPGNAGEMGQPAEQAPAAAPAAEPAEAEAEDGVVTSARNAVRQGIMSVEEATAHYRLSADEVEAIGKPAPSPRSRLQQVEAELRNLAELRKSDAKKYWGEEVQARERELIGEQQRLKAGTTPQKESDGEVEGDAPALVRSDGSDLAPELREAWEKQGGLQHHLGRAQSTAEAMMEAMSAEERGSFVQAFNALPEGAATAIYSFLAIDPGGSVREASAGDLEVFSAHGEACADVLQEWGRNAARKYATASARVDLMLSSMSEADAAKAEAWFRALSAAQKASVVKALAGK
jgi:hypothetical protein